MLNILCTQALTEAMTEMKPALERISGQPISLVFGTSGGLVARLKAGEDADVIVVAHASLLALAAGGLVESGSCRSVARTGLGVSIKAGRPHPSISTPELFRRTLLAASSIAYPDPADGGASGIHFAQVLERMGIAAEVGPRSILVKAGGECGHEVAEGKAELAVQMISELLPVRGTELIGPFPPEYQNVLVFSAGITTSSRDASAAGRLVTGLGGSVFGPIFTRTGLEQISAIA